MLCHTRHCYYLHGYLRRLATIAFAAAASHLLPSLSCHAESCRRRFFFHDAARHMPAAFFVTYAAADDAAFQQRLRRAPHTPHSASRPPYRHAFLMPRLMSLSHHCCARCYATLPP